MTQPVLPHVSTKASLGCDSRAFWIRSVAVGMAPSY